MEFKTPLCELAYKYRTDKCPQIRHSYSIFYHELFKDKRDKIKKVFEMGIGFPKVMSHVEKKIGQPHITGASLFMWRDYFPNAMVYGADWDARAMTAGERVKTFICDERYPEDIKSTIRQTGNDIDIFIDDGAHEYGFQLFLAKTVLPLLKKDVVYIIEDVFSIGRMTRELKKLGYECEVPKLAQTGYRENLLIVKNNNNYEK